MTLVPLFQRAAAPDTWAAFATHPDLEAALWQLVRAGQAAWPQLLVAPEQLVGFLARQLPPEAADPAALATLRAGDLHLVCALWLGDRAAQEILERDYMPQLRRALSRIGVAEAVIADVQQNLYGRLIERRDAEVVRRGYAGRGELGNWLCICAVREAMLRGQRAQRELALSQVPEDILQDRRSKSPESAALTGALKEIFQAALRESVAALTPRERNLLRYYFLAELTIDQIGEIYSVHRATAARWVARAQEQLATKTRSLFALRAQVSTDSLPQVMEIIQSQLSVNLGSVLRRTTDGEPPPPGK